MSTKTLELNLLLKKVERASDLAEISIDRMKKEKYTLKDFNFPESMQWYVDLRNNHKFSFKFPRSRAMTDEEIKIREQFEKPHPWDHELFSLLVIRLDFHGNSWKHHGGAYYFSKEDIHINSYYSADMHSTVVHEIGHAFHIQLSKIFELNSEKIALEVMNVVFQELGHNEYYLEFEDYCEFLTKYISSYATKDHLEAFAEIFKIAYSDPKESNVKKKKAIVLACQKGIEHFNSVIKGKLYSMYMK